MRVFRFIRSLSLKQASAAIGGILIVGLLILSSPLMAKPTAQKLNVSNSQQTSSTIPLTTSSGGNSSDATSPTVSTPSVPATSTTTPSLSIPSYTYSSPSSTYTPPTEPDSSSEDATYTPPATPTPTYTIPNCTQLTSLTMQVSNAQSKLENDETYAEEGVNPGLYGVTSAGVQSYWNNQISQDEQALNTAQQQLNNYKQQNPGC